MVSAEVTGGVSGSGWWCQRKWLVVVSAEVAGGVSGSGWWCQLVEDQQRSLKRGVKAYTIQHIDWAPLERSLLLWRQQLHNGKINHRTQWTDGSAGEPSW